MNYGDMIRADQVRQGTGLNSARIADWGYEPDLYKGDLYTEQVPVGGWMPHLAGAGDSIWPKEWSARRGRSANAVGSDDDVLRHRRSCTG
jgi:hypothetical protein